MQVPASTAVEGVLFEELRLAARNHALPLEALRYPITPVGLHYVLTHYDIPVVDPASWRLAVGGGVVRPLSLSLGDLRALPAVTRVVTFECAGNGRALLEPRPISQPWLTEAVGTAEWTGVALGAVLEEAGLREDAVEVLFSGLDRGIEGDVEQVYERSLPISEALGAEALLVYEMDGVPLPVQHGFPLRLVVAGWYGMTQVKWLSAITAIAEPFEGYQQRVSYRLYASEEESGQLVTRMLPRSLTIPPGIPDFLTRARTLDVGQCLLEGRAWSGWGPVVRVEVSTDRGRTWSDAQLGAQTHEHAWRGWSCAWGVSTPGSYVISSRATDAAGNVQPLEPAWNLKGYCNNAVERIPVTVRASAA
jgi:sulfane dehydrogenase subunit SoxC